MTTPVRVLHIASGDLWAGAEVQAFTLMFRLRRMRNTEVAAVLMNAGTLADRLHSAGVPVYVLDERKTSAFGIFLKLREVLRSWRPDVIHTHRQKENILGSLANRSCQNVASVRTVHGAGEHNVKTGVSGVRHRMVVGADRWCGRLLQQKIIAVTGELGDRIRTEFQEGKVVVIENGVDPEDIKEGVGVAGFRAAEPDVTHIGIAGRLVEVKRVDIFLETAALLIREHPQRRWRFHVFGEGPMRHVLEERSEKAGVADKVIFHGHRDDIATCIAGLDVLVMCSDHEGMPMVALEAAALGVPTVAHAVGGLVEVVPEEFLVFQHDAHGYGDGVLRALRADGRAVAGSHAVEALGKFSAQRNAERVRALYEQVLAGKTPR